MPLPIIPALVVAGISLLLKGCGNGPDEEEVHPTSEANPCIDLDPIELPPVQENETLLTDGEHLIIYDDSATDEEAQALLDRLPKDIQGMQGYFGISSPRAKHIIARLHHRERVLEFCPGTAAACVKGSVMTFSKTPGAPLEQRTYMHELNHVLRNNVASLWWGLEEGLATYTSEYFDYEGKPQMPEGRHVESVIARVGTPVDFQAPELGFEQFIITGFDQEYVSVQYTSPTGAQGSAAIPVRKYFPNIFSELPLIFYIDPISADHIDLKIYEGELKGQIVLDCLDTGFRYSEKMLFDGREAVIREVAEAPFVQLQALNRSEITEREDTARSEEHTSE